MFDDVVIVNCDICHDRQTASSWDDNNNNNNDDDDDGDDGGGDNGSKNMRRPPMTITTRINVKWRCTSGWNSKMMPTEEREIEARASLLEKKRRQLVRNCMKAIDSAGEARGRFVSPINQHQQKELKQ